MTIVAMLILAFGPLDWSFPWWVWFISYVWTVLDIHLRKKR